MEGATHGRADPDVTHFTVVSEVEQVEIIARGVSVRERHGLVSQFGGAHWRKMKGVAIVRLTDGATCRAELHWYESHGIGRRKLKIKRFLE